ncbi:MAG: endolytic transglycosylase MltG [Chloroflexota bacterium]
MASKTGIQNPKSKIRNRKDPYEAQRSPAGWLGRLFLLFVALSACFTAGLTLYGRWQVARQTALIRLEGGSPDLGATERLYLEGYLVMRAEQLTQPIGRGAQPVSFLIQPGQSANDIATNLVTAGLLADTELFLNYLRYFGLDSQLAAGTFEISPRLTIPELAATLTRAVAQEIELRFLEGWRMEEMANYLAVVTPAAITAEEFLALAGRQQPLDLSEYDFLASLPAEARLEGFLFPDTYRITAEATAADLLRLTLENFGRRVTPAMRQAYGAQGLSLYQAVTLASIVEREVVLAAERPIVASVFLNRLAQGMKLDADPTVQYAVGYQAATQSWWKSPLDLADLQMASPYNTYLNLGLPPGPIANPGLASLQAVAAPEQTPYLFFVADCAAATPGAHLFSATFEEHLVNVERCQ